jgi:hypothetical protein
VWITIDESITGDIAILRPHPIQSDRLIAGEFGLSGEPVERTVGHVIKENGIQLLTRFLGYLIQDERVEHTDGNVRRDIIEDCRQSVNHIALDKVWRVLDSSLNRTLKKRAALGVSGPNERPEPVGVVGVSHSKRIEIDSSAGVNRWRRVGKWWYAALDVAFDGHCGISRADTLSVVLLLASENEANLLDIEAALWGQSENLDFDSTFEGVFEQPESWPDRRVGFGGPGFQEREETYERQFLNGEDQIPDEAPLSMGFVAGFGASIPEEEAVTLKQGQAFPNAELDESEVPTDLSYVESVGERDPGVFAQGTLKHLSHLEIDLSGWYDDGLDSDNRHQMYSPYHTEDETNDKSGDKPGSGLVNPDADDPNEVGPDATEASPKKTTLQYADKTEATASGDDPEMLPEDEDGDKRPTTGHSQKAARARYDVDGDGEAEQLVLRRDWDAITPTGAGDETAGYLFNVPMRFNESVYSMLDANYNVGFTSLDGSIDHAPADNDRIKERNGIAPHMSATRRGNWLVPPITMRSLPYPQAEQVELSITQKSENYIVEVTDIDGSGSRIDPETVRFGRTELVNKAQGAEPTDVSRRAGTLTFTFPADETGLSGSGTETKKLFGKKKGTRKPVTGTERV